MAPPDKDVTSKTKNFARDAVQPIFDAALQAADPAGAVRRHLARAGERLLIGHYSYNLSDGRIFLVAAGKAALSMTRAALEIIGADVYGGVVITKQTAEGEPRQYVASAGGRSDNIAIFEAGHPVSNQSGVRATGRAIQLLEETKSGDLLLCLLSGGASALLTQPQIAIAEWQLLIKALLESGCTINELNCVRKQLDRVKGGGLAELAAPASTISLILSDVVGNPLDVIGSGPTAANAESPGDALTILHRYDIMHHVTPETWAVISEALTDPRSATSLARFEELEVKNIIVGDVRSAATAAVEAARKAGFQCRLLTAYLQGEAREVGAVAAAIARELSPGEALVLGGETTVTVRGAGVGGRNQELALSAAISLTGHEGSIVAAFATDGEDGMTGAAGAVVTGQTALLALDNELEPRDYLQRNDSHTFFLRLAEQAGHDCLLRTGPTGTNVNDLLLLLSPRPAKIE